MLIKLSWSFKLIFQIISYPTVLFVSKCGISPSCFLLFLPFNALVQADRQSTLRAKPNEASVIIDKPFAPHARLVNDRSLHLAEVGLVPFWTANTTMTIHDHSCDPFLHFSIATVPQCTIILTFYALVHHALLLATPVVCANFNLFFACFANELLLSLFLTLLPCLQLKLMSILAVQLKHVHDQFICPFLPQAHTRRVRHRTLP